MRGRRDSLSIGQKLDIRDLPLELSGGGSKRTRLALFQRESGPMADLRNWLRVDIDPNPPAGASHHADPAVEPLADTLVRVQAAGELIHRHGPDVALHPAGVRVLVVDERRVGPEIIEPPAHGVGEPALAESHFRALGGKCSIDEKKVHPRPSLLRKYRT